MSERDRPSSSNPSYTGAPPSSLEHIETLIARYAKRLPQRVAVLRARLEELGRQPDNDAAYAEAVMAAHRLAGSAGSYGFSAVSEAARKLEQLLRSGRQIASLRNEWQALLQAMTESADSAEDTVKEPPVSSTRRARLLVVDDDPDFLQLARELGRRQLIDIVAASRAEDALELAKQRDLDGVILDVWLGEENSFALADQLRQVASGRSLPLAFTSADTSAAIRAAAAHAGAVLYLTKPLAESQLAEAASQLVAVKRAESSRILIVDDEHDFLQRAAAVLARSGFHPRTLSETERILPVLDEVYPDALLLDLRMPGLDGLDVCRILRTNPRWQDLPILIVTGAEDRELRMQALRAGCDDYIIKSEDEEEFAVRVESHVNRRRLLRARVERDALTGLWLRRAFVERLRSRLSEAQRHGGTIAICLLDLDGFKRVNDNHGHLAGDRVLSNLGYLLATRFREEDLRARWGGEEFALAFPGQTAQSIRHGVEEVLEEFRTLEFKGDKGETFHSSFSAGLAEYPTDGVTIEALIKAADRRLYAAKDAGRSRVI